MSQVRRRPSIFSYFSSFTNRQQQSTTNRYGRSDSVTSNLRHDDNDDPYKKASRQSISADSSPVSDCGVEMTQGGRTRLFKAVGIVVLVVLALWFFMPAGSRENVEKLMNDHTFESSGSGNANAGGQVKAPPTPSPPTTTPSPKEPPPTKESPKQNQPSDIASTRCTKPSQLGKPLVQYALMVDAGSTGSRIHVYKFNNCGETPELENEVFKIVKPGLSSYENDPEGAAKSLDVLLDTAVESVPASVRTCTPIAVKATAGLRLLGESKSKKILEAVQHRLKTKYPFPVVENGVSIMDGKDEGVYAWITTNFLLGKIGTIDKTPTAAIFDLGGASTQIVFEPTFPTRGGGMPETLKDGDHKYELTFGGRHFILYQHSHLGYGLMEARKAIHYHIYNTTKHELGTSFDPKKNPITNPCIPPGMSQKANITISEGDNTNAKIVQEVTMIGPKSPAAAQCRGVAESILEKTKECTISPCSFNGVHQPPLALTFAKEDAYVISYFYDRLAPLGMPTDFSIREMKDVVAKVCAGEQDGGWESFMSTEGALEELRDRPEHCLDLSFMVALLHTGYEMPIDRELKIAKKIKGSELGWCLGASLPMLDQGKGGWECKIQEVS